MTIQSPNPAWPVRAVQLDLARQRETFDELDRFFGFAAEWGYTTVQLYLEGCVRTEHFPYPAVEDTYSSEELRRIGGLANKHGLAVIPAANTVGHAEHFLRCPELADLAEPPRAFIGSEAFCLSRNETYEFLAGYLADLAELLPGEHLHVGCDEAWTIGQCEHCRSTFGPEASFSSLFRDHLIRLHDISTALGRRMWIWDDCLAYLTCEDLAALPKDIVLCLWEYKAERIDPSGVQGQFNGSLRWDRLGAYARLGFQAVVCPRAMDLDNAATLTDYARRYDNLLGGIQTMWGLKQVFLPSSMVPVAFAGQLWSDLNQTAEAAWQKTAEGLFPHLSPAQRSAVRAACAEMRRSPPPVGRLARMGPTTGAELTRQRLNELATIELNNALGQDGIDDLQRDIIEGLICTSDFKLLAGRLRQCLPALNDPRLRLVERQQARDELLSTRADFVRQAERFEEHWRRFRPDLAIDVSRANWQRQIDAINALLAEADPQNPPALLVLRLVLPDVFGAPHLRVELGCDGHWRELLAGVFKPPYLTTALYTVQMPVELAEATRAERVRLTASGFGSLGVAHVALCCPGVTRQPIQAIVTEGSVCDAALILADDSPFATLGQGDHRKTFLQYTETTRSTIEVTLNSRGA